MLLQHLSRCVRDPLVPALVQCWPTPHSSSVPCCTTMIPRCSVTPPSVSTTKFPRCVNPYASSRCRAPRFRATGCVSTGESIDRHDALFVLHRKFPHGTWRVEYVASKTCQTFEVSTGCLSKLRSCIPCRRVRCRVGVLPDMPVSLTRCGGLSARQAPVPCCQVVHSAWRRPGSSVDAPPREFPRQSRVAVFHTAVQHVCLVARSKPGFLRQLELLPFSF